MSVGSEGVRVVVLGDDGGRTREVATALEGLLDGLEAVTATGVEAAVERLEDGTADCVFACGWGSRGVNGVERLADAVGDYPLVVEVDDDTGPSKVEALEAGTTDAVGPLEDGDAYELLANRLALVVSGTHADRTAREAQQRYHRLLEASPAAIVIYDAEGTLLYANPAAAELVGADDPHDVVGESLFEFVAEESSEAVRDRFETVIGGRERVTSREIEIERVDGGRRYAEAAASPVTVDGDPGGQAVLTDITGLKEREQRFRTERDRFTALFEALPEPAVHVAYRDEDPIVENVNTAFADVFGYDADTIVGESLNDYIVPDERADEAEEIDELARAGSKIEREVRRLATDGERQFLFRAQSIDAPGGDNEGVGIYIDVTDQKRREQALQRQNERLDAFASIVSHDLQSPLSVAKGNLFLAREEDEEPYLDNVDDALDRMECIIENLLRLARSGEGSTDLEPVEGANVVAEAWTSVNGPGGELDNRWDDAVLADRGQLRELLENLFRNAVEHGGDDVTVEVGPLADGFYVADDGSGIPEEDRQRVFEPGYTTHEEGTGFGLVVVEEIAAAHGWEIEVTGRGAGGAPDDASDGSSGRSPDGVRFEFRGVEPVDGSDGHPRAT